MVSSQPLNCDGSPTQTAGTRETSMKIKHCRYQLLSAADFGWNAHDQSIEPAQEQSCPSPISVRHPVPVSPASESTEGFRCLSAWELTRTRESWRLSGQRSTPTVGQDIRGKSRLLTMIAPHAETDIHVSHVPAPSVRYSLQFVLIT